MEIGIRAVLATQTASMPLKEIAQFRHEAGAVREVRKQVSPIFPLQQVIDEAHECGRIEVPPDGELVEPHPVGVFKIDVSRSIERHVRHSVEGVPWNTFSSPTLPRDFGSHGDATESLTPSAIHESGSGTSRTPPVSSSSWLLTGAWPTILQVVTARPSMTAAKCGNWGLQRVSRF